jgi:hypothetical protein
MDEFIKNQHVHDLLLELMRVDRIPDKCTWGVSWESIRLPEGYEKPPKEAFEAKLQELIDAQPLKELRQARNKRLAECDWVVIRATSTDTPIPEEWKVYMQALRDLPSVTEDPANPVWPSIPTA